MSPIPVPIFMLAALAVAAPLSAQDQPPPPRDGQDIVVTGQAESKAREAAVRGLTTAITTRSDGQVARFSDPVCAASVGFEPQYDRIVVERITAAARDAGIAVDKPGCAPNLTVVMVDNGQAVLKALYKARPGTFSAIGTAERKRLLADSGPVHVLTLSELRDRDGERVGSVSDPSGRGANPMPMLLVHSVSIINPSTRQDIAGSVVLIDRAAAMGKTLRQLGDYAAMRALARTRDAGSGDNTILKLFGTDAAAAPAELTSFDRAYLRGLYRGPATRSYLGAVSSIASSINRTGAPDAVAEPVPTPE
ncbi:hypothetical protein [Sphingomonas sp.]|uniref:hypothetical protein n=1 Tax=Sphingomonas sp. TaxID=28214 RepID=UPI002BA609E6|nr:hypothetical protein [Sphingomonas sp.]HWK36926.1 hypothetical protein [Sphingomonas sp.]